MARRRSTPFIDATLGALAVNDPTGDSPFYAPLINEQAALVAGASPGGLTPTFHQAAPAFDEAGLPTGLQFTAKDCFICALAGSAAGEGAVCLGDVRLPTLNLAAAGGFGQASVYSTKLLGSADIATQIVSLKAPGEESLDFGHFDLWFADNADKLVRGPMLDRLKKH
jgi:hypothetical protein